MKVWLGMPPRSDVRDWPVLAKSIESVGVHGVTMGDHLANPKEYKSVYPNLKGQGGKRTFDGMLHPSPLVMIGAMSSVTTQLEFTMGVFVVPFHHPILLAKDVATASALTGGRFQFGIGVGWMREEFEALGLDFDTRGRRMDEMLELMQRFWNAEYVAADTTMFQWDATQAVPYPYEPVKVPLIFGGHTPPALRRTVKLGDGWISMPGELEELKRCLKIIAEGRREEGREHLPFEIREFVAQYPTRDAVKRYEELGIDAIVIPPWMVFDLQNPDLQRNLDGLSKLGDDMQEWLS